MSSSAPTPMPPLSAYALPWIGTLTAMHLASMIYGISLLLAFFYYTTYRSDRTPWKVLVAIVLSLDTAALGLFIYAMHYFLILSWGNPDMILINITPVAVEYTITALLVFVVQMFYINIVRALRAPLIVTLTLLALSLTALVTSGILTYIQIRLHLIPLVVNNEFKHQVFNASRSAALICDVGIVVALRWLLRKSKSNVPGTSSLGHTLMVMALQRGVLQAIIQAGEMIAYVIRPSDVIFLPFHVIVTRIYTVSFLATLIMRGSGSSGTDLKLSPPPSYNPSSLGMNGSGGHAGIFTSMIALEPPFLTHQEVSFALEERQPGMPRNESTGPGLRGNGSDTALSYGKLDV